MNQCCFIGLTQAWSVESDLLIHLIKDWWSLSFTCKVLIVYPIKYKHGFVVFCFVYIANIGHSKFIWITDPSCCVLLEFGKLDLPISFRVTSLALGQSYDCPSAGEMTLEDISKYVSTKPQQTTTQCSVKNPVQRTGTLGQPCPRSKSLSVFIKFRSATERERDLVYRPFWGQRTSGSI